jgi:tight adherence protein B
MSTLERTQTREKVLDRLRKEMNHHIKARSFPLFDLLARKAQLAKITISPGHLMGLMGLASVMAFVALSFVPAKSASIRLILACGIGFGGVYLWLNSKAKARIEKLEEQLPDAIEMMVRSLRVGHPLTSAIAMVAKEMSDPLGSEFGTIADEAAYGRNITESLSAFAERIDNQDLRFLAVAVSIQQSSGGNLAEILDGLAKVIRGRFQLYRRVVAITAEAKFSGTFLSMFPVLGLVGMLVIRPNYFDNVMQSSYFLPATAIVFILLVVNVVFMKIMTNIKV